ncbi:glycerophosphodiester phosphodiesterase family protein [Deferribacter thermophilus]|uniref:glycerophosphodiester phosphodiesterase family protein n=1 Tax=Deferribacter thermophilus TaxID=53573 RepID=UPI003C268573
MKIIAHRGASFYAPENTKAAFDLAIQFGVDGLEMDVHLTKDNQIVVIHDESTGRTGSKNLNIKKSKYTTLRKINVGSWFDIKYKKEKIPLLADIIDTTPSYLDLYIEIKCGTEIIDHISKLIEKYKERNERFVLFSFNYDVVFELKRLFPSTKVLWIVEYGYNVPNHSKMYKEVYKKIESANLDGISTLADLSHCIRMAKEIKKQNWLWNVWTVDNPHLAKQFMSLGVTSLSTNRPDWIINNLKT